MTFTQNKVKYLGVVFLDIDGVLLPTKALTGDEVMSTLRDPDAALDMLVARSSKLAVGTLKAWCDNNRVRCVLISSWRRTFALPFIQHYMRGLGLYPTYFHVDWDAPLRSFRNSHKCEDMWEWLSDHANTKLYTVIDDHDLNPEAFHHSCRQVQVQDPTMGLTPSDLDGVTIFGLKTRRCHLRMWNENKGRVPHARERRTTLEARKRRTPLVTSPQAELGHSEPVRSSAEAGAPAPAPEPSERS